MFGQMKRISCAETVKKVNATYVIKVTGVGTFYIDYSQVFVRTNENPNSFAFQTEFPKKNGCFGWQARYVSTRTRSLKISFDLLFLCEAFGVYM